MVLKVDFQKITLYLREQKKYAGDYLQTALAKINVV
jgi:hypothetical protein